MDIEVSLGALEACFPPRCLPYRLPSLPAAFPRPCLPSLLLAGTRGVAAPRACSGPCLQAFYQKHDPSKLDKVDEIYEKYPAYKLVAILKKK